MIVNYADSTTQDIYDGTNSKAARKIPQQLWPVVARKLDALNAAHEVVDVSSPPGNRLQVLKGDRKGLYSIRINDQYRIIFRWSEGNAHDVQVTDYH